jgi:hypothetical protein
MHLAVGIVARKLQLDNAQHPGNAWILEGAQDIRKLALDILGGPLCAMR